MPEKNKKKRSLGWLLWFLIPAFIDAVLIFRYLLHGKNVALFSPKGLIAREQHSLMVFTVAIMLVIAIPALTILFYTAWKYRESNTKATHVPNVHHSKYLIATMWLIPITTVLILASVMWPATHRLEPKKTIAANTKPITIQVVALRWKWLFIYPEQKIATVNFAQIPVDTPVRFELTADEAPMSSFWVPNLGGQLYAMTGHVNPLNLIADTTGDYRGISAEINGAGFSGMKFTTRVSGTENFNQWIQEVRQSPQVLDAGEYQQLVKPSENNTAAFYASVDSNLYDKVVMKYTGPEGHKHGE